MKNRLSPTGIPQSRLIEGRQVTWAMMAGVREAADGDQQADQEQLNISDRGEQPDPPMERMFSDWIPHTA